MLIEKYSIVSMNLVIESTVVFQINHFTMDALNDFLNLNGNFKRETLPGGYVNARTIPKIEPNKFPKREFIGSDYGDNYRRAELQDMKKV